MHETFEEPEKTLGDTTRFVKDRFGMFIHWGLYALPAKDEWIRNSGRMTEEKYDKYFRHFNPDLYDPRAWAKAAADAGMKYFVVTTKHHDGFCMWDSALTDYKVTNTAYGKDVLRPMVDAFREQGIAVGFYHSLIDWHHPEFTIDGFHPLRNHPDAAEMNKTRDMKKYVEYLHGQVEELLTGFGKIDILWFDFSYPGKMSSGHMGKGRDDWQSEKLHALVRKLQPHIILNDRLGLDDVKGSWDVKTPEQWQPQEWLRVDGKPVVWEACQTFSGSWGYSRDEASWKSPEQLIKMLINSVSCGGNLLMNVGPTGRGLFDNRALAALDAYSNWMQLHERAITGCTASTFKAPADCRLTQNGKKLYIHVYSWPFQHLHMEGLEGKIEYAQLLNDSSEISWKTSESSVHHEALKSESAKGNVVFELPVIKPDVIVPVIEVFLK